MKRKVIGIALMALLATKAPVQAQAATVNQNLSVSLTVAAQCVLGTAPSLGFGSGNLLSGAVDASSTMSVTCTTGTPYRIQLGAGTGSGATTAQRRMTIQGGGTQTVQYNLFTDAARSTVWGTGTTAPMSVAASGNGSAQSFTIFGRVPQQAAAPGNYVDTVSVVVEY